MNVRNLALVTVLLVPGAALAADTPQSKTTTFTKDIAPIFQEKCESCHRTGSIAPMSLVTYQEARPWAQSIANRVKTRQMPPWHLDKTIGIQKFKNDRSLSDDQIDTILRWVAAGSPQGDPKDMPAPKIWSDEAKWNFASKYGQPDLVIKAPEYTMPAVAQDVWWRPSVATGLTEPRWVRAIEIRPATIKGRRITHHALARLQQPEDLPKELFTNDPNVAGDGLFMEWAVGKQGDEMRPGSGRLMLPGSKIVFEMHYHAVGEEITDHVELAVY
ncbi:MAG TPA: cytochrome c, partial [Vicinamibacterales bacterium]|nr:cytochrome c [Vicinamibacterales bacterium]